jgi:NAD(P)H-hydrate epimerase
MTRHFSRAQSRLIDRRAQEEFGVPGIVLMENAGRGCVEVLLRIARPRSVVVCCGKGNNGGDGFVIARHLDNAGVPVRVLLFAHGDELRGDAAINYEIVRRSSIPLTPCVPPDLDVVRGELADADWVVDALFGTGLSGAIGPPLDAVVEAINNSGRQVLAVDIPSGLDCDTGLPLGPTVRTAHTATFVGMKEGFAEPRSVEWTGEVHVVDIGAPREVLTKRGQDF